jgi:hypothetical protein
MPISVLFKQDGVTTEQYFESLQLLETDGLAAPEGRLYHFAFVNQDGNLRVLSIWDSRDSFDTFYAKLYSVDTSVGIDLEPPEISEIVNIVVGG